MNVGPPDARRLEEKGPAVLSADDRDDRGVRGQMAKDPFGRKLPVLAGLQ
jgi:hypothetical protein